MKNKGHWLSIYWRKSDIEIYIFKNVRKMKNVNLEHNHKKCKEILICSFSIEKPFTSSLGICLLKVPKIISIAVGNKGLT